MRKNLNYILRGYCTCSVGTKAKTLWEKDVLEQNCLVHERWEAKQIIPERKEQADREANVKTCTEV